jgi:hypothetical protein
LISLAAIVMLAQAFAPLERSHFSDPDLSLIVIKEAAVYDGAR